MIKQEILNFVQQERNKKVKTAAETYANMLNVSRTTTVEKPDLTLKEKEIARMGDWLDFLTDNEVKPINTQFYGKTGKT